MEESTVVNEWVTEGRAVALLDVLAEKFGPVPAEVATTIRGTTDAGRLRGWMSAAIQAAGLDEFRKVTGL